VQRAITVQKLVRNWVIPHMDLGENTNSCDGDRAISSTDFDAEISLIASASYCLDLTDQ